MKKLFLFFCVLMTCMVLHARIEVQIAPQLFKDSFTTNLSKGIVKVEYDATNKDSLPLYANQVSYKSSGDYIMLTGATSPNKSYMFSMESIPGYYIRKVEYRINNKASIAADATIDVTFSKNIIDSLNVTPTAKRQEDQGKTFAFYNADPQNTFWNLSVGSAVSSKKNAQIMALTITYLKTDGSEDGEVPIPIVVYDTLTVKQALDSINKTPDKKWTKKSFVKGRVCSVPSLFEGKAEFYMVDDDDVANNRIQAFGITKKDGKCFTSQSEVEATIHVGDVVLVSANELKFYEHSSDSTKNKNEINGGIFDSIISPYSLRGTISFYNGKLVFDPIEGEVRFYMLGFDNDKKDSVDFFIILDKQEDLDNDVRGIAHNYEKTNDTMYFVKGENEYTALSVHYLQILVTYLFTDNDNRNTYEVTHFACVKSGSLDSMYIYCKDTFQIIGENLAEGEIFFTLDNGTDVRKMAVDRAVQEATSLEKGVSSDEEVYVYGYWVKDKETFSCGTQSFYISDVAGNDSISIQLYKAKVDSAIVDGDFVCVRGKLQNYNGAAELSYGEVFVMDPADCPELLRAEEVHYDTISPRRAYEIGMALSLDTTQVTQSSGVSVETDSIYVIIGYCTKVVDSFNIQYKNETWLMDTTTQLDSTFSFQAYRAKPDSIVKTGDKMMVTGKISKYCAYSKYEQGKLYYNIQVVLGAIAVHTDLPMPKDDKDDDDTAIFETSQNAENNKTIKVIENGKIVIIRNGEKFDILGTKQ